MTQDQTAPATKQDIALLMEEFGKMWLWKAEVDEQMFLWGTWKQEIIRHFDVVAENIQHNLVSANRDEIVVLQHRSKDHGERIEKIERVVGLAA